MARKWIGGGMAALALLAGAGEARAKPAALLDCPLRDAPFSLESPFVDVLLSPAARGVIAAATGTDFAKTPAMFTGTVAPTFAAILTTRQAISFGGRAIPDAAGLDAALRALPVTQADKVARCARYDAIVPQLDLPAGKGPRLLLFEKINGFRDTPSVEAARAALVAMAARLGWRLAVTDKAGAFNPRTLARFDAVIWNNNSGDVLTVRQRKAFRAFMAGGGGYVGIHGAAGDPAWFWDWYPDVLVGARFSGHPMQPQFQEARIMVDEAQPLTAGLPAQWRMTDEWYSFKTNPRRIGANVLLTLDEGSYTRISQFEGPLDMGDHPIAWTHCVGRGRAFYSAIGHLPATYSQPQNVSLLEHAIAWAATARGDCPAHSGKSP